MSEDTAELLRQLGVGPADLIGWSDGGKIALRLAMRHPERVRKVIVSGSEFRLDGNDPAATEWLKEVSAEEWPAWVRESYAAVSPDGPDHFPVLFAKLKKMWLGFEDWHPDELRAIGAPVMVVGGDQDMVRPEHFVEMWRLIPHAELCVLPGTGHRTFSVRDEWLNPMMASFLDEPMPEKTPA